LDTSIGVLNNPDIKAFVAKSGGIDKSFSVYPPMTQAYYGEQLIYLLRCLPLQTGFETFLPIANSSNGNVTNHRVSVEGRDLVVTPAITVVGNH